MMCQNNKVSPDEFAKWLDSGAPKLSIQNSCLAVRFYSELNNVEHIEELAFYDIDSGEIQNRFGAQTTAILVKREDIYYICALSGITTLSAMDIFSSQVILVDLTKAATELCTKIYAAMVPQVFSGKTKLLEGGFLGTIPHRDEMCEHLRLRKPWQTAEAEVFVKNPNLLTNCNACADLATLFSYYSQCDDVFLHDKIKDIELISYMKSDHAQYITHYADTITRYLTGSGQDHYFHYSDSYLAKIIDLDFVISYLNRYFPTPESQKNIVDCGNSINAALTEHNASTIYISFPKTDKPLSECTADDLFELKFRKNQLTFPFGDTVTIGLCLDNSASPESSWNKCSNHPLSIAKGNQIPWSKIHHIVHLKKTIWTNPEITTQEP